MIIIVVIVRVRVRVRVIVIVMVSEVPRRRRGDAYEECTLNVKLC